MNLFAEAFISLRDNARSGMADGYLCLGSMELGQIPGWEARKLEVLVSAVLDLK